MDDLRFRWLKDEIYTVLNIGEGDPAFDDFLEGDDGATGSGITIIRNGQPSPAGVGGN